MKHLIMSVDIDWTENRPVLRVNDIEIDRGEDYCNDVDDAEAWAAERLRTVLWKAP